MQEGYCRTWIVASGGLCLAENRAMNRQDCLLGTPSAESADARLGPKRDDGLKRNQPSAHPGGHPSMRRATALSRLRINVTRGAGCDARFPLPLYIAPGRARVGNFLLASASARRPRSVITYIIAASPDGRAFTKRAATSREKPDRRVAGLTMPR